jgi:hypothetical protein
MDVQRSRMKDSARVALFELPNQATTPEACLYISAIRLVC